MRIYSRFFKSLSLPSLHIAYSFFFFREKIQPSFVRCLSLSLPMQIYMCLVSYILLNLVFFCLTGNGPSVTSKMSIVILHLIYVAAVFAFNTELRRKTVLYPWYMIWYFQLITACKDYGHHFILHFL